MKSGNQPDFSIVSSQMNIIGSARVDLKHESKHELRQESKYDSKSDTKDTKQEKNDRLDSKNESSNPSNTDRSHDKSASNSNPSGASNPPRWNRRRSLQPTTLEFQLPAIPQSTRISTPLQKKATHIRTTSHPPRLSSQQSGPNRRHSTTSVEAPLTNSVSGVSILPLQVSVANIHNSAAPHTISTTTNQSLNNSVHNSTNSMHPLVHNYSHNHLQTIQHANSNLANQTNHTASANNVLSSNSFTPIGSDLSITGYSYSNQKKPLGLHRLHLQKMMNQAVKRPGTPVRQVVHGEDMDRIDSTESSTIEGVTIFDDDGLDSISFLSESDEILTIMSFESAEPEPMIANSPVKVPKQVHLQNLTLYQSPNRKSKQHSSLVSNRQRILKYRTLKGPLSESVSPSALLIQGTSTQRLEQKTSQRILDHDLISPTPEEEEHFDSHESSEIVSETTYIDDTDSESIDFSRLQHDSSFAASRAESIEDMSREFGDDTQIDPLSTDTMSEGFDHLQDLYVYFDYIPSSSKDEKKIIIEKHDSYLDLVRPLFSPLSRQPHHPSHHHT